MCSKRNGAAGVRCHRAMNWPIPVANTELWATYEPLRRHVLKIVRPYIFQDVYQFEIPPDRNIVPALEPSIPHSFFAFFWSSYQKSRNPLHASKNYISKHKFFCKKKVALFKMLIIYLQLYLEFIRNKMKIIY